METQLDTYLIGNRTMFLSITAIGTSSCPLRQSVQVLVPQHFFIANGHLLTPVRNDETSINSWIEMMTRSGSSFHQADFCAHVRDEYSTFGWILEGMLKNTGFHLTSVEYSGDTLGKNLLSGSPVNKKISQRTFWRCLSS
jgi:hypothetical protein